MSVKYFVIAAMLFLCIGRAYAQTPLPSQKEYEPLKGKGRVAIIVSGQSGPDGYAYLAKDLAEQGYYAVLVDGNDFWDKAVNGESRLKGVITRAQQSPHALPGKVAVIGFSLGGASALTYATRMPDLVSAVVAYYPATSYIKNPTDFVSKVKVPTLIFAGGRDTYKDCCKIEMARKLADAAKNSRGKVLLEVYEYPLAGHGFVLKSLKSWSRTDTADAFRRNLEYLRQHPD
jgi:pimeloyl-ACP methyl ester carboxylesterase